MAIYPVLFIQYLRYFMPSLDARIEWLVSLVVIWVRDKINLRGSVRVGGFNRCRRLRDAGFSCVIDCQRIAHHSRSMASVFLENKRGFGGLAVGISIALWNYIGWDNPSTAQGEVKNASRTYPRALALRCRSSQSAACFRC